MPAKRAATPSKGRKASPARKRSSTPKRAPSPKKRASTPKRASPKRSPSPRKNIPAKKTAAATTTTTVAKAVPKKAPFIDVADNDRRRRFTPEKDKWDGEYEFGGVLGCLGLIVFSHFIMYYFWSCIEFNKGALYYPGHASLKGEQFHTVLWRHITQAAIPSWKTFGLFSGFQFLQYILAVVLPGPLSYGLRVPSENGYQFAYKCNAVYAWYAILVALGTVHYTGIYPLWNIRTHFGEYMTSAVIWADAVAILTYLSGFVKGNTLRMSGNPIYDFFMGSVLNPRLPGNIDLKLWAEIRNSWVLLFVLTLSCTAHIYKETGAVPINMWFMLVAHLLYVNACQKGEECIVTTWDIYYEKFGWMLIFWNFAGVPFVYCFQSLFIDTVHPEPFSTPVMVAMFIALFFCYYVFDTVNSQKNRFRMKRQGVPDSVIRRKTFPQLPWGYIEEPRTLVSEDGKLELFVDGWYRYGRKIHYTVDMCMSLMWGLSCNIHHFIPFFYFCFFFTHLTHRQIRDDERCRKKYGKLWDQYVALVPYKFIPYVY